MNILNKNILMRTNLLVCTVVVVGFVITAMLSYRANVSASLENIQQVSALTSEGIYYQMSSTFSKPLNISLTMANDSLLHELLLQETDHADDAYINTMKGYLENYQTKYHYDSVFLVSAATCRYYNFGGLDRILDPNDPEDVWYYNDLLGTDAEYTMNVDNDQVSGAGNAITLFVNCKIRDSEGELLGVVGVGVRIDGLQRTLQSYRDQFYVEAFLVNDAGIVELSPDYSGYEAVELFDLEDSCDQQTWQNILDWKEADTPLSFWSTNPAGQKQDYVVARYLPDIKWHLVVERDTTAMVKRMHQQLLMTVLIIVIILGILLMILTKVIRRFNQQIVDLTKAMEEERQAVFEQATEQLFENIYELDITHNRSANQATARYFESQGASPGLPYDKGLRIIAEKQIKPAFRQGYLDTFLPENVLRAYETGQESLHYDFMISKDGISYYWMRITARLVWLESDRSLHMLTYRQNIDAEKRRERKLQDLAETDEMTGLLTKTATSRRIDELLEAHPGEPFAYFILDIDNFKQANDQFGHPFGDSVICAFASALQAHFREEDVLGRIGGDEFVVFVPGPSKIWVEKKAWSLCQALCVTHTYSGMSWDISTSIGIALAPEHGTDAATLYKNADIALYVTKERRKNGFTLYDNDDSTSN